MCRTANLPTLMRIQAAGWRPMDCPMVNGHEAPAPRALNDKIVPLPAGDQLPTAAPNIRSRGRRNTFLHVTIPVRSLLCHSDRSPDAHPDSQTPVLLERQLLQFGRRQLHFTEVGLPLKAARDR